MPAYVRGDKGRRVGRLGPRRVFHCTSSCDKSGSRRAACSEHASAARVRCIGMPAKKWSQHVTETSNALDLRANVFDLDDPKEIAKSLKRSAEDSRRRKSSPYRSAMSMLTFYINRAGTNLSAKRRKILERAKDELRAEFGRGALPARRRPAAKRAPAFELFDVVRRNVDECTALVASCDDRRTENLDAVKHEI